jgi:arylsulfate sulfotransferase
MVTVEFGTDTNYGLQTWSRPVYAGGTVNIEVAGMRANTTYHMHARLDLPNGSQAYDLDQVFTTGGLPANLTPNFTTTTSAGMTPQLGVEMDDFLDAEHGKELGLHL